MTTPTELKPHTRIADLLSLIKPSITLLVLITTIGGIWLAPGELPYPQLFAAIFGTLGVVIGANTLNCYLERDTDKAMTRTRSRPLPSGRMNPAFALRFGLTISVLSIWALWYWVNQTTTILALIALISYVWVYTPMKRLSPQALTVGSIPGAMPPLRGWSAVTDSLDWQGIALFAILFFWQIPHFIAIAIYRQREYEEAGLKTIPSCYGMKNALWQNVFWSLLLVGSSISLTPLGVTGTLYTVVATILGILFLYLSAIGFIHTHKPRWARRFFLYTLIYLTLLFTAMAIDANSTDPVNMIESLQLPQL